MTAAGVEARSVARWAWQDPQERAVGALERVNEMAARASDPQALREIQDAATMLSRLVSSVNRAPASDDADSPQLLSSQLSGGLSLVSRQIDLVAIHGRHVPGTAYTFRHGWIPLIGGQLLDKYPDWKVRHDNEKALRQHAEAQVKAQAKAAPPPHPKHAPAPPSAQERKLTPEQRRMVTAHQAEEQKARSAAVVASRNAALRSAPMHPSMAAENRKGVTAAPVDHVAAAKAAVAQAELRAATAKPGTLAHEDPALASLAAPGASMAALKSYIDARVAAEVARQVGQITEEQNKQIQEKLANVHKGQQKLISFVRKQTVEAKEAGDHTDRTQLVMYNLFNLAALGVTIGGIVSGMAPVIAAMAAATIPVVNIIHDYVRSSG